MSDLIVALPVIFFFLAVVAVVVWICKGFLQQRAELSPLKTDSSGADESHRQAA